MKKLLGGLFKKQAASPVVGRCTLYASYGLGVANAVQGAVILWPDPDTADQMLDMTDPRAVGNAVLNRLALSIQIPQGLPKPSNVDISAALFYQMNALIEAIGRRPRRVRGALVSISVRQIEDSLLFERLAKTETEYVFQSITDPDDQPRLTTPYSAPDVGNVVLRLLAGDPA